MRATAEAQPSSTASAPASRHRLALWLRQLIDHLPSERLDNYDDWLRVGFVIYSELPGEDGRTLWDAVSQRSQKYQSGACGDRWKGFTTQTAGPSVTVGTLIHWIRERDPAYQPPPRPGTRTNDDTGRIAIEPTRVRTWAERRAVNAEPQYRPAVIEGLLRRSEILNLISAPKVGKSWLAMQLAIAAATGGRWLGRNVHMGRVLLVDCELHDETIEVRLKKVAEAMGVNIDEAAPNIQILTLRNIEADIISVETVVADNFPPGYFGLITTRPMHVQTR